MYPEADMSAVVFGGDQWRIKDIRGNPIIGKDGCMIC